VEEAPTPDRSVETHGLEVAELVAGADSIAASEEEMGAHLAMTQMQIKAE
jgi:hypothetical protein